jgi:hypothetical protein
MARRRVGGPGTARSVFSILWIALGGLSAYYLFTLFADPSAAGDQSARMAAPAAPSSAAPVPAPAPASSGLSAEQLGVIDGNLQTLSQQLAALDQRLRPIENFIGPAAKLPPSSSVSTSPPRALPKLEPLPKPEPVVSAPASPPEPAVAEAPKPPVQPEPVVAAPPPPVPTPTAAPKPELAPAVAEAPKPTPEPAAVPAPQPVPTPTAAPKPELAPAVAEAPKPTPEPAAVPAPPPPAAVAAPETETEVVQEEVAIAAIDPVTLPPAANDGSTRYGIEIGSVGKRDELRPLWREYLTKHAALVAGLQPRRVRAPDNRWRLIAGPFANAQDAEGACSLFKRAERPCAATVYAGDAL